MFKIARLFAFVKAAVGYGQDSATIPFVTRQPASVEEFVGGNVAFSVATSLAGTHSYEWSKNGARISGATSGVLFIPAVQPPDAGVYLCLVSVAGNSATTVPATLSVRPSFPPVDPVDPSFVPDMIFNSAPTVATLQMDGRILLGGTFSFFNQGRPQSGLARVHAHGALDPTLASGVLNGGASIEHIAVQSDGKIIVAGSFTTIGGTPRPGLARLNTDGSIDASFSPEISATPGLRQIELTTNGRLLLVDGSTTLRRLNPDGRTDETWRFTPIRVAAGSGTSISTVTCTVERVASYPDGRVAVIATTPFIAPSTINPFAPPQPSSQFSRAFSLNTDGTDGGRFFTDSISNSPIGLRVLSDRTVVLVGRNGSTLHTSLRGSTAAARGTIGQPNCAAIGSDGAVWGGGAFTEVSDLSASPIVRVPRRSIVRLRPDMTLDDYDSGAGLTDDKGIPVVPNFIVPLPDGGAIIGGSFTRVNSAPRPQFARLKASSPVGHNPVAILDVSYQRVRDGEPFLVTVRVTGSPPFSFPAGYTYDAATGTASITLDSPGGKTVRAANPAGGSTPHTFVVQSVPSAPVITQQPTPVFTNTGRLFQLGSATVGTKPLSYQWFKDGRSLNSTSATYTKSSSAADDAGEYRVTLTNSLGSATSTSARVLVDVASRLQNFSTLALAGRIDSPLVVGFVLVGHTGKGLLARAVGPTLTSPPFRVPGMITDPQFTIFNAQGSPVYGNDNWTRSDNSNILGFATAFYQAFPLAATADAAGYYSADEGAYSMVVSGVPDRDIEPTGFALAEIYEADQVAARLVGFSARSFVAGATTLMRSGFVIGGNPAATPMRVLIRAIGPGLSAFGITNAVADLNLTLLEHGTNRLIAANDDWDRSPAVVELRTVMSRLSFPLVSGSRDAAVLVTIPPGTYSCIVAGSNGSSGTALIELFEVQSLP